VKYINIYFNWSGQLEFIDQDLQFPTVKNVISNPAPPHSPKKLKNVKNESVTPKFIARLWDKYPKKKM
jgi:hypothetical protein